MAQRDFSYRFSFQECLTRTGLIFHCVSSIVIIRIPADNICSFILDVEAYPTKFFLWQPSSVSSGFGGNGQITIDRTRPFFPLLGGKWG